KAKALLAAAGYGNGFTFDCLSMSFFGVLGDPVLEAMAKYYKAIGVTMNILTNPATPGWANKILSGKYVASGYVQTPLAPVVQWYQYWIGKGALENFHGYVDPVIENLHARGLVAENPKPYWAAISRRVTQQAYFIPVFANDSFWYTT